MPSFRLATFNVENLFSRPPDVQEGRASDRRFGMFVFDDPAEARNVRRAVEAALSDDERQLTAQAIIDTNADFICLQEVENEASLRLFRDEYLHRTLNARVARDIKAALPALSAEAALKGENGPKWLRNQLELVRSQSEGRHFYRSYRVVDGNDGRGIDVGFLSKLPVISVTSHAHLTFADVPGTWSDRIEKLLTHEWEDRGRAKGLPRPSPQDRIFRRDCLEVLIDVEGTPFTVFICHLKANPPYRELTYPMRRAEVLAVKQIINTRFADKAATANWAICGDLNDFTEVDGSPLMPDLVSGQSAKSALSELLDGARPFGFDVNQWIADAEDRWTSYFGRDDVYSQLDHIIVSPGVAERNPAMKTTVVRTGQPYRAERYKGPRYPRVGWDRPKASDHCPIVVELLVS
ncbi:MAG: endonuclease/exonuclease/phosphatase family protein [Beijerinckiaceae bacterium]